MFDFACIFSACPHDTGAHFTLRAASIASPSSSSSERSCEILRVPLHANDTLHSLLRSDLLPFPASSLIKSTRFFFEKIDVASTIRRPSTLSPANCVKIFHNLVSISLFLVIITATSSNFLSRNLKFSFFFPRRGKRAGFEKLRIEVKRNKGKIHLCSSEYFEPDAKPHFSLRRIVHGWGKGSL